MTNTNETYNADLPDYAKEIDPQTRAKLHRIIDHKMKTVWSDYWTGVSFIDREDLLFDVLYELDRWWKDRPDQANKRYTKEHLLHELDFYLPKSFWKHKRNKSVSASRIFIDPDWKTFRQWNFAYDDTKTRLAAERKHFELWLATNKADDSATEKISD